MLTTLIVSDILLICTAVIWLTAACITDLRKREVPDWLSFSLIAIALAIRGIISIITSQPFYFFYALIALAIFFAVTNILYYGRVFGGGDAKLLLALSAVLATTPLIALAKSYAFFPEPFLLTFVINIFALGFCYGFVFSIIASVKNRKNFSIEFKKENKKIKNIRLGCWIAAIAVLAVTFFIDTAFRPLILFLFVILFIAPLLYSFIKAVENSSMIKKLRPNMLAEGDWLVKSVRIKNKIIKPSVHGLNSKDIALLKKANKSVWIKIGLPFVPIFLAALICSLLFGNLLMKLILLFI